MGKINANKIKDTTKKLAEFNYVTLRDVDAIDMIDKKRNDFVSKYYSALENDIPEVHAKRERARDAFFYSRENGNLEMKSAKDIAIVDKNYEGTRNYKRFDLLKEKLCVDLAEMFLSVIPSDDWKQSGNIGINLFRTYDVITETRHQDYVDFVLIYCLNVNGAGAITQLSSDKAGNHIIKETCLKSGDIFIFKDAPFFHYTTPLIATDDNPVRDVIIMTIGV